MSEEEEVDSEERIAHANVMILDIFLLWFIYFIGASFIISTRRGQRLRECEKKRENFYNILFIIYLKPSSSKKDTKKITSVLMSKVPR